MSVRIPRGSTSTNHRLSDAAAAQDNRVALMDQAFYAGHRAVGQKDVMQVVWLYERAVDMDGLKHFHGNLSAGLLGRLIERSPLPFGRYRWVSDPQQSELDIAQATRPPSEMSDWLDERSQLPIDPESGPGWRLSVLPLTDGSTVLSLVISHYLLDGVGGVFAVALAALGDKRDYGYPPPHARTRWRAIVEDAVEAARELPQVGRALIAATIEARRRRAIVSTLPTRQPIAESLDGTGDRITVAPGVWIRMNLDEWDARAKVLGGTGGTLATALTAKLRENMAGNQDDGSKVQIALVVGNRTENDTRAIAVSFAAVTIDPAPLTKDLRDARLAIKKGLKALRETTDASSQLVALTPFTPGRVWKRLMDQSPYSSRSMKLAVCSNLGEVGSVVSRPDGTACDYAWFRGVRQDLTQHRLERLGSQLHLYFGQGSEINKVGMYISAYQSGSITSKAALRDLVTHSLAEFGLTGQID